MSGAVVRSIPKGLIAGRFAKSLMIGARHPEAPMSAAASFAEAQGWERSTPEVETVVRALVNPINGAALIQDSAIARNFLELVRPTTLVDRIPGFRPAAFYVPQLRVTGRAQAGFVRPGYPRPFSAPSVERITLTPYKVASGVVETEELVRGGSTTGELAISQELAASLSEAMNRAFIDPHAGPVAETSPGSITYGATTISSSGSSLTQVSNDLAAMIAVLSTDDEALTRAVWVMHRAPTSIALLRGTGGSPAFPAIGAKGGTLLGLPVFTSGAAYASGSPGEAFIVLLDPRQVLLADPGSVAILRSEQTSIQLDDAPTSGQPLLSLWQNDLVGIMAERAISWTRTSDTGVVVLENVTY